MKTKHLFLFATILLIVGIALATEDHKPAQPVTIPEKELNDIRQRITLAQAAIDGYSYLESLIVDKELPCHKQLLRQAETDKAAKVAAYQALYYSLRDRLLNDSQKEWQPDYQKGVFEPPKPAK